MADNVTLPGSGAVVATDQVTDGTLGTVQVQYVKIMDGTLDGTSKAAVGSNGLKSDVAAVVPGTAATNLGKAEDAAHSSGDTGVMVLAVRNDTRGALAGTDQDYIPITTNAKGDVRIDASSVAGIAAFPAGFLRVTDEPRQVMYDPFDSAIDTTDTWTVTSGNSAVAASNSAGVMSMGTGTTASGWSKLVTQASFKPSVPAWTGYSFLNLFPDLASPTANAFRFWGAGTTPGTPSVATPLTDAIGFEITTAGKMVAVVYANGSRTAVQDLSSSTGNSTQPTDANGHRYIVYIRSDKVYWYIDSLDSPVATSNFNYPNVQTLPLLMLAVGNSTPPTSNTQIQCVGATVWDTGKNATQLADGAFPWRKATVKKASTAVAATDLPLAVGLHPTSPLPSGSNTIGALTANQSVNVAQVAGTATDTNSGNKSAGTQRVVIATDQPSLTNALPVSQSGTWTVQPGNTANSTAWLTQSVAGTTGGWSINSQTALTNTKVAVKASAGTFAGYMLYNPNSVVEYVQVFDVASASVTLGTTTPTYVIPIPPSAGANVEFSVGIAHATAITLAATTTATGSSAPTTSLTGFFLYK